MTMTSLDAAETQLRKMGQDIADTVARAYEDRTETMVIVKGWSNVAGPLTLRRAFPMISEKMASCPNVRILRVDLSAANQYSVAAEIRKQQAEALELGLNNLPPLEDDFWRERRRSEARDLFFVVIVNIVDSFLLRRWPFPESFLRHRNAPSIILISTTVDVPPLRLKERIGILNEEMKQNIDDRSSIESRLTEQLRKLPPKPSTDGDANIVERHIRLKDRERTTSERWRKYTEEMMFEKKQVFKKEVDYFNEMLKAKNKYVEELKRYADEGFEDARELLRLERRRWALEDERKRLVTDAWQIEILERNFDNLSTYEALGLLQSEAKAATERLQQWCDKNIVEGGVSNSGGSQRIRLRMPIINDGTILKCYLYSAIVPDVCNTMHFWRIEGLFGGSGNDEFDHAQEAAKLVRTMIEEMVSRGILQVVDHDTDDYRVSVPEPLTENAQSIAAALMMIKSDENDNKSQKILFHSQSASPYNSKATKQYGNWLNQLVVGGPVPTMSQCLSDCYPNLHTLVIKDNDQLVEIPDNIFSPNMPSMHILDLSGTRIRKLPSSLRHCQKLKMLSLNHCPELESIHPAVEEKCVAHLEVISVMSSPLLGMRKLSLSKHQTLHLKTLCFADAFHNLEELFLCVNNCRVFEEYFASRRVQWPRGRIKQVQIFVIDPSHQDESNMSNLLHHSSHPYHNIHPPHKLPDYLTNASTHSGHLQIHGGQENVLHHNLVLHIFSLLNYVYISDNQAEMTIDLGVIPRLSYCKIQRCHQIKTAFLRNEHSSATNSTLSTVYISYSKQLRIMCRLLSTKNSTLSLTKVYVEYCPNLVALFQGSSIELPMLHELRVRFCAKLRSIFDETVIVTGAKEDQTCFPSLKKLHLCQLPQLVSICGGHIATMEELKVRGCWKLCDLPLKTTTNNTVNNIIDMVIVDGELKWWNCVLSKVDFDKKKIDFRCP